MSGQVFGGQGSLLTVVRSLADAQTTPPQVARARRRLGLEAPPEEVARALSSPRLSLEAREGGAPDPAQGLVVCGVDMPDRLSQTWTLGGPLWLWHQGAPLLERPSVAIVGTRRPTADGLGLAEGLAHDLATAGVTVVSGMAKGIDQAAHRGALTAGGRTTAVLGTGLGVAYPAGCDRLQGDVAASGGIVTEYPPGHGVRHPSQFLARNRILVGLTDAVVVIEAGRRSGALNSATWATTFGRDVLVVPASPSNRAAEGSLALLADGAIPVRGAADVLALLRVPLLEPGEMIPADHPCLTDPSVALVFDLLAPCETAPSELAFRSGMPIREVLVALSRLEDAGLASQGPAGASSGPVVRSGSARP